MTLPSPVNLGLHPAFRMVRAPLGKTFFYRGEHKRVIETEIIDGQRLRRIPGPLIYAVTDQSGAIRYIGKWVSPTPLYARWFRHETVHHHKQSRDCYLAELDAGRGPLTVWSASASELRRLLPSAVSLLDHELVVALEGLWVRRWRSQLQWNYQTPKEPPAGFDDGEYWRVTALAA